MSPVGHGRGSGAAWVDRARRWGRALGRSLHRGSGLDGAEGGGPALIRHASFWLRLGFLASTPLSFLFTDQASHGATAARVLILVGLIAWTAGLYAVAVRVGPRILGHPGTFALDLAIALAAYGAAGGWSNLFVIQTYGPIVTAAAYRGLLVGTTVGFATAAAQIAVLSLQGLTPGALAAQGDLAPALISALSHPAFGAGVGWFVLVAARLERRSRGLAEALERERLVQSLSDRLLGQVSAAARSASELATAGVCEQERILALAGRLSDAAETGRRGLEELARERDAAVVDEASGSEPRSAQYQLARTALVIRTFLLLTPAVGFISGGPDFGATPVRVLLLGLLGAWTGILWWVLRRNGVTALRNLGLVGADLAVLFGTLALSGPWASAFGPPAFGAALLAGALGGWRRIAAVVGLSCALHLAIGLLISPALYDSSGTLDARGLWVLWGSVAWGTVWGGVGFLLGRLELRVRARAEAAERERVLQEVHDHVLGIVAVAAIDAALVAAEPSPRREVALTAFAEALRGVVSEARRTLRGPPGPGSRSRRSVPAVLSGVVASSRALAPTRSIRLDVEAGAEALDWAIADELGDCAREGIANAIRHARPGAIELRLGLLDGIWALRVRDPGRETPIGPARRGLAGMQTRAERIGASWSFSTGPGGGELVLLLEGRSVGAAGTAPEPLRRSSSGHEDVRSRTGRGA